MSDIIEPQTSLRETLQEKFQLANEQDQTTKEEAQEASSSAEEAAQIARDEKGRFSSKDASKEPIESAIEQPIQTQEAAVQPSLERPKSWKREYQPIWDKLALGAPLTEQEARHLAEYSVQREKEFASGISTHKTEAQNARQEVQSARQLQEAIAPFLPDLQRNNVEPSQWIANLGNAHKFLSMGTPQQKIQTFAKLAEEYGVPLGAISQDGNQINPVVTQLMTHIQKLESKLNTVSSWTEQQEQAQIQRELARFEDVEKYPYFEQVRVTMGQLLASGIAPDLDSAYAKAVRTVDDVWQMEQERQAQVSPSPSQAVIPQVTKVAAAAKAKASAVSPRSASPTGTAVAGKMDLRSAIASRVYAAGSGARI